MSSQLLSAPPPAPAPSMECRVYERHPCHVPTSCHPAAAGEMKWAATIRDVSRSGLRVNLQRRFETGSGLAIEVPGTATQEAYSVFAKVVHLKRDDAGGWALGCRFLSELSEDELARLLAHTHANQVPETPPEGPAGEAPTVVPDVRLRLEVGRGRVVRGRVKRLHVAGAWPLAPGAGLTLRGVARDGSELAHAVEVVRCSEQGGWTVHVRLRDPHAAPAWLRA